LPQPVLDELKSLPVLYSTPEILAVMVFQALSGLTTVYGVRGNMDGQDIASTLPLKQLSS